MSTLINIPCSLGRQEEAPFWYIDGDAYELFSIPQDYLPGGDAVISVVNSYASLTVPLVTSVLDGVVFQCATFGGTGLIRATGTRLRVLPS